MQNKCCMNQVLWILKRLEYLYIQKVLQENFDISIFNITSVIRIKFLGNKHFIPRGLAVIVMMCTIANWQYLLQILTQKIVLIENKNIKL